MGAARRIDPTQQYVKKKNIKRKKEGQLDHKKDHINHLHWVLQHMNFLYHLFQLFFSLGF